jgi:hypothetical protein
MAKRRKRNPGQTWPGLEPGEGSPFDDDGDSDGGLVEFDSRSAEKEQPEQRPDTEERTCRKRKRD